MSTQPARRNAAPQGRGLLIIIITAALVIAWAVIPAAIFFNYDRPSGRPGVRAALHLRDNVTDTDSDGLTDYDERIRYGTNLTNPDTDGDGINDWWEVRFGARDPKTGEWIVDPNDPKDAYEDPDNDGYDFNHNGCIDGSEQDGNYSGFDWVYLSRLRVARHADYMTCNLSHLLSGLEEHRGEMVRIASARVVDNGSYKEGLGVHFDREISLIITDPSTNKQLPVMLQARSNRPVDLKDDNSGISIPADIIDVQGVFEGSGLDWRITVRGTERFTNLMEFLSAHDYDNDPYHRVNWTDPNNWDTDGDGMSDGWEVYHGIGYVNTSLQYPRWEWIALLDPTWDGDAAGDGSPFTDIDGDRIYVSDRQTGQTRWVGYNRDEYLAVLDNALLSMVPRSRLNLADLLGRDDIPGAMYAYGMNPSKADTDGDSYDVKNDGLTPGVDTNCEDFDELFIHGTDPENRDTDRDGMWDGWEVHYGLSPKDPADAGFDPDGDGFTNLQEHQGRTDPKDPASRPAG